MRTLDIALASLAIATIACAADTQSLGSTGATGPGSGKAGAAGAQAAGAAGTGGSASGGSGTAGSAGASAGKGGAATGGAGGSSAGGAGAGGSSTAGSAGTSAGKGGGPTAGAGGSTAGAGGSSAGGAGAGGSAPTGSFVRFGYVLGQEKLGDLCVSYSPGTWEPDGVLSANGLSVDAFEGLTRLTRYLPLSAKPVAFGRAYAGQGCAGPQAPVAVTPAPETGSYFTVLSMPYSLEPTVSWVVTDEVEDAGLVPVPGVRIVNATTVSKPIVVGLVGDGVALQVQMEVPFATSPTIYQSIGDTMLKLHISTPGEFVTVTVDWIAIDLLPLAPHRTIYVGGMLPSYGALACADAATTMPGDPTSASCYFLKGTGSP